MVTDGEFLIHSTRPDGRSVVTGSAPDQIDHPSAVYVVSHGVEGEPPETTFHSSHGCVFGRSGWGEFQQSFERETFYSLIDPTISKDATKRDEESEQSAPSCSDTPSLLYMSRGLPWIVDGRSWVDPEQGGIAPESGAESLAEENPSPSIRTATSGNLADVVVIDDGGVERTVVFHRGGEFLVLLDRPLRAATVHQTWGVGEGVVIDADDNGIHLSGGGEAARVVWPLDDVQVAAQSEFHASLEVAQSPSSSTEPSSFVTVLGVAHRDTIEVVEAERDHGLVHVVVRVGSVEHEVYIQGHAVTDFDPRIDDGEESSLDETGVPSDEDVASVVAEARTRLAGMTRVQAKTELLPALTDVYRRVLAADQRADHLASLLIDLAGDDDTCFSPRIKRTFPHRRDPFLALGKETVSTPESGRPWPLEWVSEDAALAGIAGGDSVCSATAVGDLLLPWAAISPGIAEVLVVRLHGAVNRQQLSLPAFPGLTSAVMAEQPQLVIQDPSLDLDRDLRLGWYLGSQMIDGHRAVADLVQKIASAQGITKIIIQGNSGGGFAALHVASMIPNAIAVAHNPQTDLRNYHKHLTKPGMEVCLGGDVESADAVRRLSVIERWASANVKAHVLANTGDEFHMTKHVKPLEEAVASNPDWDVQFHYFDWGPGHVPPPNADYQPGIDLALADLAA